MGQTVFDERAAKQLDAMYQTRDISRRRRLVREALGAQPGQQVIDIGCGPGFTCLELLADVGPAGAVTGIDTSEAMLNAAHQRCNGHGEVHFRRADATSLPFPPHSFDRAVCVQVLEFVPDVPLALSELYRVLRPGGRAVVWDVDWASLSWHSADPIRMGRILQAWDRHAAHPMLPRTLAASLRDAGFTDVRAEGHAFLTTALDPETYGGFGLGVVEAYLEGLPEIDPAEATAWATEQRALAASGAYYYAVLQVCFLATRPI